MLKEFIKNFLVSSALLLLNSPRIFLTVLLIALPGWILGEILSFVFAPHTYVFLSLLNGNSGIGEIGSTIIGFAALGTSLYVSFETRYKEIIDWVSPI